MTPDDIKRMNRYFETTSYDTEPGDAMAADPADLDPDDDEAAGVAYFTDDGRLLLMQRSDSADHGGLWSFPAGMVEDDETAEQAALREFAEETGQTLDAVGGSVTYEGEDGLKFTAFQAIGPKFTPRLDAEHTAFTWATPDNMPKPLHPGVLRTLQGLPTAAEA